jgi:hypothetical protein
MDNALQEFLDYVRSASGNQFFVVKQGLIGEIIDK